MQELENSRTRELRTDHAAISHANGARGWIALGLPDSLAVFRVFGQHRIRVGPTIPDISLWWFLILAIAAFFFHSFFVATRQMALGVDHGVGALGRCAGAFGLASRVDAISADKDHDCFSSFGTYLRSEQAPMTTLQIEERKYLNRLAGRRRDVLLEFAAYVRVPTTGFLSFRPSL